MDAFHSCVVAVIDWKKLPVTWEVTVVHHNQHQHHYQPPENNDEVVNNDADPMSVMMNGNGHHYNDN